MTGGRFSDPLHPSRSIESILIVIECVFKKKKNKKRPTWYRDTLECAVLWTERDSRSVLAKATYNITMWSLERRVGQRASVYAVLVHNDPSLTGLVMWLYPDWPVSNCWPSARPQHVYHSSPRRWQIKISKTPTVLYLYKYTFINRTFIGAVTFCDHFKKRKEGSHFSVCTGERSLTEWTQVVRFIFRFFIPNSNFLFVFAWLNVQEWNGRETKRCLETPETPTRAQSQRSRC